jgi:ribonucleoside-diphosphate reductase beta chain
MSLFEKRDHYKPFSYPWAFEHYRKAQDMHWLPEEVPLSEDVNDWKRKLNDQERNLLTQLFRFFTQGDTDILTGGYLGRYIPAFPHPEIGMMLSAFATAEANHMHSYSLLLDTIGMPEAEYQAFQEFEQMKAKHEYLFADRIKHNSLKKLALDLAIFSAFGEGMQLFSSFAILMSFQRRGLMKGMSTIVEWSIRDESLHVAAMIQLFHTLINENPEIWTDSFKAHIYQACREMVDLEDGFIDLAFELGDVNGVTAEECKTYIRYIADRRLLQLGLKPNYGIKENPFDWLEWIMNAETHTNFFESRSTEYSKGGVVNWDRAFAAFDSEAPAVIETEKFVVYGKADCPYCHLMKAGLTKAGVEFEYISLDNDAERLSFYDATGTKSVPQVCVTSIEAREGDFGSPLGGWDNFEEIISRSRGG